MTECDTQNCEIDIGHFRLLNNRWGDPNNPNVISTIFVNDDTTIGWSWNNPQGWIAPEVIVGTNFGWWNPSTWSVFPIQYKNLNSCSSSITWRFLQKPTTGSWWNLCFDLYWMDSETNSKSEKHYNVMIWIHGLQEYAGVPYIKDVNDGFNTYSYYSATNSNMLSNYDYKPQQNAVPWDVFILKNRESIPYEPEINKQYSIAIDIKKLMSSVTRTLDGNWWIPDLQLASEASNYTGNDTNSNVLSSGKVQIDALTFEVNGQKISLGITPTITPTIIPTATPTVTPTIIPTVTPTITPTIIPTVTPTPTPTITSNLIYYVAVAVGIGIICYYNSKKKPETKLKEK